MPQCLKYVNGNVIILALEFAIFNYIRIWFFSLLSSLFFAFLIFLQICISYNFKVLTLFVTHPM